MRHFCLLLNTVKKSEMYSRLKIDVKHGDRSHIIAFPSCFQKVKGNFYFGRDFKVDAWGPKIVVAHTVFKNHQKCLILQASEASFVDNLRFFKAIFLKLK